MFKQCVLFQVVLPLKQQAATRALKFGDLSAVLGKVDAQAIAIFVETAAFQTLYRNVGFPYNI